MKIFVRIALLTLLQCLPTLSQEFEVNVSYGLICDTPQQVERFAALHDSDVEEALAAVNAEAAADACKIVTFTFILGPQVAIVKSSKRTFRVVQVLVLGVFSDEGFEAAIPQTFFTLAEVDEGAGAVLIRGRKPSAH